MFTDTYRLYHRTPFLDRDARMWRKHSMKTGYQPGETRAMSTGSKHKYSERIASGALAQASKISDDPPSLRGDFSQRVSERISACGGKDSIQN